MVDSWMTASVHHQLSTINYHQLLLRAQVVLPVSQPPIPDGAVLISGRRIAAVGRWRDLSSRSLKHTLDLGYRVLMPGLVNAHCHLDYTDMAGQFPPPKVFSDWLKLITEAKAGWSYSDYAESWLNGAHMLVRTGTTSVADIEAVPELLPEVRPATPLRVFSFLELIGIKGQRQPRTIVQEAVERIDALTGCRGGAGLSPHAPYSTVPELLRLSAQTARRHKWRLTTHVAESALEFEMFTQGRGPMFDWLQRSGRDMSDCGLGSPVRHLERCGVLGESLLAVNVCLGTDSLASVYKTRHQNVELNLFEEMRALAKNEPSLSARRIVQMATLNGARALGMSGRIGELAEGGYADLVALPFAGKVADIYDAVLHHIGDVAASMIDGQWAIAPG
ncbi:MAG: amidohydrolase family protein [Verrucomicrobia bacterium]|nr:amidohydrolase family protein [Verrucomicrobiota bacterium]